MPTVNATLSPRRPTVVIFDTENDIFDGTEATSLVAGAPRAIQVGPLAGGTSVQVQVKLHPDADWINHGGTINSGSVVVDLSALAPNFARLVKTGSGTAKAWAMLNLDVL